MLFPFQIWTLVLNPGQSGNVRWSSLKLKLSLVCRLILKLGTTWTLLFIKVPK